MPKTETHTEPEVTQSPPEPEASEVHPEAEPQPALAPGPAPEPDDQVEAEPPPPTAIDVPPPDGKMYLSRVVGAQSLEDVLNDMHEQGYTPVSFTTDIVRAGDEARVTSHVIFRWSH
jgi:hypothetical protein